MRSVVLILSLAFTVPALGEDWPQFLGPNRNGVSVEKNLLAQWPENGPREEWRVEGGVGNSGLAISQGKCVTLVQREGQQRLVGMNVSTGAPLWDTPIAPAFENQMGDGPRATPTIAGDRIFCFTGEGILVAASFKDGKVLWSIDLLKEFGAKMADYGMAASPLVVDGNVIVMVGAKGASVVAVDAVTGKVRWSIGDDPAGYSSPALLKLHGQEQVVAYTGSSVLGVNPRTGVLLWRFPFETDYQCNIAVPLALGDDVFISSGENHGSALLSLTKQGELFTASPKWESLGPKSVMRNEWQTSVLLDGYLYGFDNVGGAGPVTHLNCVDAKTGKRVWQEARFGKGNLIAADGKLFIVTLQGELIVAKASPKGYEELGRKEVIGQTRQAPSLSNGFLFLRDDKEVVCLDVRGK
jgi:outer membrane protein assembly factor BamB